MERSTTQMLTEKTEKTLEDNRCSTRSIKSILLSPVLHQCVLGHPWSHDTCSVSFHIHLNENRTMAKQILYQQVALLFQPSAPPNHHYSYLTLVLSGNISPLEFHL